ncbi:MAG TPA: histidinol phosphate phosphatase domain-containing protein [Spirochaetota bacterium]|nr:histidinol phosphate phosphatase domain-containing protein [Spirochaetota bacterium]
MIDFHSHTFFSDGALSPAEHIRRAVVAGYKAIGLTDHVDFSNIEFVYNSLVGFVESMRVIDMPITIIPGIEITHVPPKLIEKIVAKAKDMKIPLIVIHGESPVEPVEEGTNRAAIESCVDILAHPGLIKEEDVKRATELGVSLEITVRRGHSLTNGYVAKMAKKYNTKLVLDSDAHSYDDFLKDYLRQKVMVGCGMEPVQILELEENMKLLLESIKKRMCIKM